MRAGSLDSVSYTAKEAARRVGIGYHLVDAWARHSIGSPALVAPTIQSSGQGTRRRYSFRDVVALRVAVELRALGLHADLIRLAAASVSNEVRGIETPQDARRSGPIWIAVGSGLADALVIDDPTRLTRLARLQQSAVVVINVTSLARELASATGQVFTIPARGRGR